MELSRYVKAYPYEERQGYVLLFSTRNASKVLVKEDAYQNLRHGVTPAEKQALLSKLGMVVPDHQHEQQDVLSFFEHLNERNKEVNLTAVMNLDCNFACLYCYEGEQKGAHYMSAETADSLVAFAEQSLAKNKNSLLVDFYGGEPLLSLGLIKDISERLKNITEDRGALYRFTLVTNGSLFKRSVAEQLVPLGLYSVRITLDGPAENHNRYRPFTSGRGSFDAIIKNIKETCDLTRINIGGNYERDNYRAFPLLLDYLMDQGLTPDKITSVKFDPVNKCPEGDPGGLTDYNGGCRSINEPWLAEASTFLREEILKRGYFTPKAGPIVCMVEQKDSFVIGCDGRLYKCPALLGREEFVVGSVGSEIEAYDESHKLDNWKNEECAGCEYLPLCFGGCRYATLVQDGTIDALDCKKEYFDSCLETIVKQDIAYQLKNTLGRSVVENGKSINLSPLTNKIDEVIARYFPDQFASFTRPGWDRMASCYRNTFRAVEKFVHGGDWKTSGDPPVVESAFFAVAAIRYIDDFIDQSLWPTLSTYDSDELSASFSEFMYELLGVVREFDPELPETIIQLPLIEIKLALYPDQETFDRNFEQLFMYKSFDLFYIYEKIKGKRLEQVSNETLARVAVMEHIRDFASEAISAEQDLNLYKHIRDNNLDPRKFIQYLMAVYRQEDPVGYRRVQEKGLFEELEDYPLEDVVGETEVPYHELFSFQFERAINLLKELM